MSKFKPNPPKVGGPVTYVWCQSAFGRKRGAEQNLDAENDPRVEEWEKAGLIVKKGSPMPEIKSRTKAEVKAAIEAAQKRAQKEMGDGEEGDIAQRPGIAAETSVDGRVKGDDGGNAGLDGGG